MPGPLDQLPSTALAAVHAALCSLPHPRDAAAFRCTCHTIHDEVLLPEKLELSYALTPQPSTMRSLGHLLRLPQAANTQLSISIADWGPFPENEEDDWGVWPACEALHEAGEKLSQLSIPCDSIGISLCAVREQLPHVRSLVLSIDNGTAMDALDDIDPDPEEEGKAKVYSSSRLTSLTLQAQPGIPPICIFDLDAEIPLQLQRYPSLQHFVLVGPLMCEPGEPLFLLPPDTTVTIDPGLGDRPPTRWARTPVSCRRFADMPDGAVPDWDEYKWEDFITLKERLDAWFKELVAEAIRMKNEAGRTELEDNNLEAFFSGSCYCLGPPPRRSYAIEDILSGANIEGRWDLITPSYTHGIAAQLLEDFAAFWHDPAALLGHNLF